MSRTTFDEQVLDSLETVVRIVQERFIESQIDKLEAVPDVLCKLVSDNNVDRLLQLAHDSISMTDNVMTSTLQACFSTQRDQVKPGTTVFYIRSINLTCSQLKLILEMYHHRHYDPIFVKELMMHIAYKSSADPVALRYIGCTSNQTPHMRHLLDLSTNDLGASRYANMVSLLKEIFNDSIQVNVYTIPLLQLSGEQGDPSLPLIDVTEQILIHLFGRQFLLNVQPGGHFYAYVPQPDDQKCVRCLTMTHAKQFLTCIGAFGNHQDQGAVFGIYQASRAQLSISEPNLATMLSDAYLQHVTLQAAPHMSCFAGEFTPMAIFGKEMAIEDSHIRRGFFQGCRAGTISQMMIQLALGDQNLNHEAISFVDLWILMSIMPKLDHAIATTSSVLRQIRCLTMVTMGYLPAAIAHSKFHGRQSLTEEYYAEIIGEPNIIHIDDFYEDTPIEEQEINNYWGVAIPHLDPGSLAFGSRDPRVLRLVFLCWIRSLLLLDCCLVALQTTPSNDEDGPGTLAFAKNLVAMLQQREACSDLGERIKEARDAICTMRGSDPFGLIERTVFRNETLRDDEVCEILPQHIQPGQLGISNHVQRYGVTMGDPHSPERAQQYFTIMRYDDAMFHECPSYLNSPDGWREWFMDLDCGMNIFSSLIERIQMETGSVLGNINDEKYEFLKSECKAPFGFEEDDFTWMLNHDLVSQARRERACMIWRGPMKDRNKAQLMEYLRKRNNKRAVEYFMACPILVKNNGRAQLRVIVNGTQYQERDGLWVGKEYEGERILDYDPDLESNGLVVKDTNGTPLRTIPDTWLMVHAPNTYFQTFVKTVTFKNKSLRTEVVDHVRYERDLKVSVSTEPVPGVPRFSNLMHNVLTHYGYPLEVEIWKELLNKGCHGLTEIKKHFNKVHRIITQGNIWTIPKFSPSTFEHVPSTCLKRKRCTMEQETISLGDEDEEMAPALKKRSCGNDHSNTLDTTPFWRWWCIFHNNTNSDKVVVDFDDHSYGFWSEFQELVVDDDDSIKQFLDIRDSKNFEALHTIAKSYGWMISTSDESDNYLYIAPPSFPPEKPLNEM
ncbi:hypothetical protein K492DRAFT_211222 [Lichtheimia hyalospora FSU 10163]|nr:hypothetical protein K492DRAFT_211222 [Lichtheimia hyalospora FSU 10163]